MKHLKFSVVFVILLEFAILCCHGRITRTDGLCQLTLPVDIPRNEPVYLVQHRNNFTIYKPTGHVNSFSSNDNLHLFCPGKKNAVQIASEPVNSNLTEVTCRNGRFLVNDYGDVSNLNEINCTKGVQADISLKRKKCSSTGQQIDVGFKLTNSDFLPTLTICYDNNTWTPIWSKHVINGKSIKFNVKESARREFKTTGLPITARPADAYKKATQLKHFTELIGPTQTETYFSSNSYLARGHLTPDADFVFPSAQWSTYFYINTCPQFQTVNAGNWLRVESLARKLAQHYDVEMDIFTGVHDTLQLENASGTLTSMYLTADEKYEVPKWMWKIIKNRSTNSAIVMITLNDPFRSEDDVEEFCTNVCASAYVDSKHFKTMRKGYTFCCNLLEFRRVVRTLPPDATAANLLSCSNVVLDD